MGDQSSDVSWDERRLSSQLIGNMHACFFQILGTVICSERYRDRKFARVFETNCSSHCHPLKPVVGAWKGLPRIGCMHDRATTRCYTCSACDRLLPDCCKLSNRARSGKLCVLEPSRPSSQPIMIRSFNSYITQIPTQCWWPCAHEPS